MKILSLTTKNFFSGIASGAHIEGGGLWSDASGISPFIDPNQGTVDVGLLQSSPAPTTLTGLPTTLTGLVGTPLSSLSRVTGASAGTAYIGTTAGVSQINLAGDNNATTLLTQANMTNGLELLKPRNQTTEYLYYWQKTQIGRWGDLNGTPTATAGYITGLNSTDYHPTHKMWDEIYYGNGNVIGQIKDDEIGGVSSSLNVLDFENNMLVTAIEDDGQFLVMGMSTNVGSNTIFGHSLIRFWKINSSSWTYEWSVPETNIISIVKDGSALYAVCPNGVYIFNSTTSPRKIRSITSSSPFGKDNSTSTFGSAVLFGGTAVGMYGKMMNDVPTSYHEPFGGLTGNITLIDAKMKSDRVLVGTDTPALFRFNTTLGGLTGVSAKTVYIPLRNRYTVNRIEVSFGEPLASGDSLNIDVQTDEDNVATDWGTYSFASQGAVRRASVYSSKTDVDNLRLVLNFNGGNVKIKQIDVYGDIQNT